MNGSTSVRTRRRLLVCVLAVVGGGVLLQASSLSSVLAQEAKPASAAPPEMATLTGKVVDLQCFMTGKHEGEDAVKCCAACIKSGVPAALETKDGLVVLGHGMRGAAKMLEPFAMQEVTVTGKLHEKGGIKYLDVATVTKITEEAAPAVEDEPEEEQE